MIILVGFGIEFNIPSFLVNILKITIPIYTSIARLIVLTVMYAIIFSFHGFIHSCDALRSFEGNLLQLSIECREKLHPLISELFPESSKKYVKAFGKC